jgi:hypothetical protein
MSLTTVQSGIGGTGNPSLTFPSGTGTVAVQGLSTNIVSGTAQSASGSAVNFTNIPSWVKRITLMFNAVSINNNTHLLVQIGTGGVATTSGYSSTTSYALAGGSATGGVTSTSGYIMYVGTSSYIFSGHMIITNISGNNWICSGLISNLTTTAYTGQMAGYGSLSGVLNIISVTNNGSGSFTAGSINILYE